MIYVTVIYKINFFIVMEFFFSYQRILFLLPYKFVFAEPLIFLNFFCS